MKAHCETCRCDEQAKRWWHWVLEKCENCNRYYSQRPIWDDVDEDIRLFEAVSEYRKKQASGETDYRCTDCGEKLYLAYNHAGRPQAE